MFQKLEGMRVSCINLDAVNAFRAVINV